MDAAAAYDITAPLDAPGRRAAAAQEHLRAAAEGLEHQQLANMLRVCADGLRANPDGVGLCDRNHDRLWYAMEHPERWENAPSAPELHIAAMAFWRAARLLRGLPQ